MSLMSRRDAGKLIAAGGAGLLAARGRLAGATMIDSVIGSCFILPPDS